MGSVEDALARLTAEDVVGRIWARDHTVWKPYPEEIADRLGWLDAPAEMRPLAPELTAFAHSVRAEGFRHVVLLGMGGSSLGARGPPGDPRERPRLPGAHGAGLDGARRPFGP